MNVSPVNRFTCMADPELQHVQERVNYAACTRKSTEAVTSFAGCTS